MLRKLLKGLIILLSCWLAVSIVVSFLTPAEKGEPGGLNWDANECRMLDYQTSGDQIRVRYSVRMVNHEEDADLELSFFGLYFTREDVDGWLKYERSYVCTLESGEASVVIPAGEYVDVVLLFEGEYLRGEVNEDLSAPINMMFMMSVVD